MILFSGACFVGISLVLAAAIFGSNAFRKDIGDEYAHWQFAEAQYQKSIELGRQYDWGRPIVYDTGIDDTFETEKEVTFEVEGQTYTLTTYLERMSIFAESDLKIPKVFSLLKIVDDVLTGNSVDRKEAFRHLYEDAIILPILNNGREKLKNVNKEKWNEQYASALQALIKIQILLNQTERDSGYTTKFYEQIDELYYFLTEDQLGEKLKEIYAGFFTDSYVDSSGWPNENFSQSYATINTLEDERAAAIAKGLSLWISEIGEIRVKQEDDMEQLSEVLEILELVGQDESEFLKRATAGSVTNMNAINELAQEYAKFLDSIKDLTIDGQKFTFMGYYLNQINEAKESVDSRVNDLSEEVNTTSKGDGMLSRAILDKLEKQREALVKSFEQIADPELIKRFEEADKNFLNKENGIEARIAFYKELAAYLQDLKNVELKDWAMGPTILDDLREQYKLVFKPSGKFTEQQQASIEKFKSIASEKLEDASLSLFKKYQSLLLAELKELIGFPVLADASRIMTEEEISDLENSLDEIVENISAYKAKMDPLEASDFDSMIKSIKKISEFVQTYLTPDMAKKLVTITLPSLKDISSESLSDCIIWRARFVQLEGFDKQKRISNKAETLGEIDLSESVITLLFTSIAEGEPGDVGRLKISGGWAPLQLLLRDDKKVKSAGRGKYLYRDEVSVNGYKPLIYALQLELPKELPAVDEWPRIFDLKGF
jgi:hypothetical protein